MWNMTQEECFIVAIFQTINTTAGDKQSDTKGNSKMDEKKGGASGRTLNISTKESSEMTSSAASATLI